MLGEAIPDHARPNPVRALRVTAVWLALWLIPVAALIVGLGPNNVFSQIAIFFSKMALVTFGGAYAVLAYVAQQAADYYHWVSPREMLDGLGMAETTPGPLIMVVQFVGFMAAFRDSGGLPPMLAATFGGLLVTWVTLLPDLFETVARPCLYTRVLHACDADASGRRRSGARCRGAARQRRRSALVSLCGSCLALIALHKTLSHATPCRTGNCRTCLL